ncbi:phytanoyl-CoA dioxygenase family protein [Tenacibaculum agarivorans]|uniref:phytanoyl-CoA dioxygenase family protein n=1 Tax=Tenacibaculum agarivorans TaxID=1908389 RepID=UPI00094BA98B|nr:phytanoyl-CoA dioxygenase family protein [Tenacibaculum agarivorans]
MIGVKSHITELEEKGFSITKSLFSNKELQEICDVIDQSDSSFAIRQLLIKIPELQELICNNSNFKSLYTSICDKSYFLSKAIFFNKPKMSNWFVNYHQDLSISVKEKKEAKGFTNWTTKNGQLGVIPPEQILKSTITFRIHLDKTDETNGALHVIPKSHTKGIIRVDETFNKNKLEKEVLCTVDRGGVMLMKPLLLHASQRSVSAFNRRVIHLEFCNKEIPLQWLERKEIVS